MLWTLDLCCCLFVLLLLVLIAVGTAGAHMRHRDGPV
jgi:hypothetical protein